MVLRSSILSSYFIAQGCLVISHSGDILNRTDQSGTGVCVHVCFHFSRLNIQRRSAGNLTIGCFVLQGPAGLSSRACVQFVSSPVAQQPLASSGVCLLHLNRVVFICISLEAKDAERLLVLICHLYTL